MYRTPSKRKQRVQLTFVYSLMTLAVLVIVAILVLVMQGYRYNAHDGRLEQGGLIQFASRPEGASVTVDTASLANRTPTKITATAGVHTVTLLKDGYRSWQKNVKVIPGGILWLNYALLVPTTPEIVPLAQFTSMTGAITSHDFKSVLVKDAANTPTVTLFHPDDDTFTPTRITLSDQSYTKAAAGLSEQFSLVSWDDDNRYVLLKHTYGSTEEWLVLDTSGDHAVTNVTKALGITIRSAAFRIGNNRQLYVITQTGEVRRVDLNAMTISGPLLTGISEFSQYDASTLTYVTALDQPTKTRSVGYLTDGARTPLTVKTYTDDGVAPLSFAIARYYNVTYTALGYGDSVEISSGNLPASDSGSPLVLKPVATIPQVGSAKRVGFSPKDARFVYVATDQSVVTYDLELQALSRVTFAAAQSRPVAWLDMFHFADTSGVLYEFDGANHQVVIPGALAVSPALSPNGKYFYGYVPSASGAQLVRVQLAQ